MRRVIKLSDSWQKEEAKGVFSSFELPYTSPGDKAPEAFSVRRTINVSEDDKSEEFFLEIRGFCGKITVFIDEDRAGEARCVIAPRYIDLTPFIKKGSDLGLRLFIEPEKNVFGDYSLYGVSLICVSRSHFNVSVNNDPIGVGTVFTKENVRITLSADIVNPNNYDVVVFRLFSPEGLLVDVKTARPTNASAEFIIDSPMRWDGVHAAYKYTAQVALQRDREITDTAEKSFGIREFEAAKDGFFKLNGINLPLAGAAISNPDDVEKDAESLKELDANLVLLDFIDPDERILNVCDELGIMVFFRFPSTGNESDLDEVKRVTRLLASHPSAAFISYSGADPAYGKKFCAAVKNSSRYVFTAGECNILNEDSLNDAVPDVLLVYAGVPSEKNGFSELQNRYNEIVSEHPDYRFAIFPKAPECIHDRHSSGALRPDCSQEYFSMWHERVWDIFGTKKNTACYFAGYLTDRSANRERTGLISADRRIKKDAFWFYKAQFSADKFIKAASLPETVTQKYIRIKCYTNSSLPVLTINGKTKKKLLPVKLSACVYQFDNVKLKRKDNAIVLSCGDKSDRAAVFRSRSRIKKK